MPLQQNRIEIFHQMTPATQALATEFEQKLAGEKREGLLIRHELGLALQAAVEGAATYGSKAVQQLALYLGMSPDQLYKLRNYARCYTRQQIEAWANRPMSNGGRLTFHHLAAIMVVKSQEQQVRLVDRVLAESLSVRELRKEIESANPKTRKGRKPTILGGLDQLIARARALVKGMPRWQETVFSGIDRAEPAKLEPLVRNRRVEARNLLDELSGHLATATDHLTQNLARVDELLVKHGEQ